MVLEHRGEYPSLWAAVDSIAAKIGCVPQTLLAWIHDCSRRSNRLNVWPTVGRDRNGTLGMTSQFFSQPPQRLGVVSGIRVTMTRAHGVVKGPQSRFPDGPSAAGIRRCHECSVRIEPYACFCGYQNRQSSATRQSRCHYQFRPRQPFR